MEAQKPQDQNLKVDRRRYLPETRIEVVREVRLKQPICCALFDFDGTLSLIREGWPNIMVPMMIEALRATGTSESTRELHDLVMEFVMELTGKQTIHQMIRLSEEVQSRGGTAEDPLTYKSEYHLRLGRHIAGRRAELASGQAAPETMLVPGSVSMLKALDDRGVKLYLASGTDENYVKEEVALLGLTPFFGPRIYGAVDDYKAFSKQMVIERILRENVGDASLVVGFGDGYVEIENVKSSGGTAVAVASDEANRDGRVDEWKRERLIGVGADVVIPDFQESESLLRYLFDESRNA